MNSKRRTRLQEGIDILGEVIVGEQEAFDNMPESIRESDKGQAVEEGLDNLNEAKDLLEDIASSLVIMIRFLICILTGTLIWVSGDLLWVWDRPLWFAVQRSEAAGYGYSPGLTRRKLMWVTCDFFLCSHRAVGGCAPKVGGCAPRCLGAEPPTIDYR